ncbi:hypothetical protein DDA93_09790 [Arthrobacter sp. Bz4]|nr:hypothetical protein DDA93_09790 [Arthrobacter sp. Bz4]
MADRRRVDHEARVQRLAQTLLGYGRWWSSVSTFSIRLSPRTKSLQGGPGLRVRIGSYRILYTVDDVLVVAVITCL